MNIFKLAWKNLKRFYLNSLLTLLLFSLGVGLISFILVLNHQLEDKFEENLKGIDLVVGAKGSPLQLILNSIFHLDAPTGNITLAEADLVKRNPFVESTIDLSMGDSYQGYRIVGTTHDYPKHYEVNVAEGKLWENTFEATIGATVAKRLGLGIDSTFFGSHGLGAGGFEHDEGDPFKVVGILEKSGTVLDQLILTNKESMWAVHGGLPEGPLDSTYLAEQEITSMLVFKRNNMAIVKLPRLLADNTDMQAASPAGEMADLYNMIGSGEQALRSLALVIVVVSAISIFVALFSSLKDRKYELALMRVMGAQPIWLFLLILLEGLILAILGYLLGILLSHLGMFFMGNYLSESYRYDFSPWIFLPAEGVLFFVSLGIGFAAALIPALMALFTQIAKTLKN